MRTSSKGISLIKQFEGCRLTAYKCAAGVLTIGYGHTGDVKAGQTITQARAEELLVADLVKFEGYVKKYVTSFKPNQNQFDALVSFAFNCGSGNLKTLTGGRDAAAVAKKLLLYNKAGGRVLAGLTRRRKAEQALFLTSVSDPGSDDMPTIRYGSRGDAVKVLQDRLNAAGCDCGKVDDIWGNKTETAVRAFQKAHGLTVDGIVGSKTWAVLMG